MVKWGVAIGSKGPHPDVHCAREGFGSLLKEVELDLDQKSLSFFASASRYSSSRGLSNNKLMAPLAAPRRHGAKGVIADHSKGSLRKFEDQTL